MPEFPTIHIKPAGSDTVRDPITRRPLADKGEHKPKNSYWVKKLNKGEVVEVAAKAAK